MFCRYCGKPLADGEVCDCSQAAAARAAAEAARRSAEDPETETAGASSGDSPQAPGAPAAEKTASTPADGPADGEIPPSGPGTEGEPAGSRPPTLTLVSAPRRPSRARHFLRNVWQCFRSYFARPAATLETSARIRDWKTGLFWAGALAVLTGLCGMAFLAGTSWSLSSSLPAFSQSGTYNNVAPSLSGYGGVIAAYMLQYIRVHYFVLFFILLIGSLLNYAGLSAAGYVIGAAMHRRPPFRCLTAAVGVGAIPSVCLTALAAVFSLFWPAAGAFLILAAAVTLLVNAYAATKIALGVDDSRLMLYYGLAAAVVLALVLALVGHFLPSVATLSR